MQSLIMKSNSLVYHLAESIRLSLVKTSNRRLSWPSWLTFCIGRSTQYTHIVFTRRLQAERRTGSVRRSKTGVLPAVLRSQIYFYFIWWP